jgi:outer membrane receptor protein involved in Fe transport
MRYNATGLINSPGAGDRFGGSAKIRTFGDFGASESIDGLPAFRSQEQEGGGLSNTAIPTIAIDSVNVLKGGRAVQYGDGTDGGVLETRIKSGRDYKNHQAVSIDASTAREMVVQGEAADSTDQWDYYTALRGSHGNYNGTPDNLDRQTVSGGLGKFGWNFNEDTRAEFLAIYDYSRPDIYRNGALNEITSESMIGSLTLDHRLNDKQSLQAGLLATNTSSQWPARSRDRGIDNQILFLNHYITAPVSDTVKYNGTLGTEYKRTVSERDNMWKNTFDDYALKSQNSLTFSDNLTLTGGLRHTWFNNDVVLNDVTQPDNLQDDGVISYQLGASYNVLEQTRVRTSFASGFNRFFSKYGNFGTDALNPAGAQDEIVESRTIEVGVNQEFDTGYLDIALYNIVQDDVPRRNNGAIESMEVDQSGLELEVFSQFTDELALSAGYMRIIELEATRADGSKVNGNIFWGSQTTPVPENQFSLRADYQAAEDIGLWGAAYYTTGYESVDANGATTERDGFTRLDLGANWWANDKLALRTRVENILDERDFGTTVQGVPINDDGKLGRVLWVGLDYTF